MSKKQVVIIGAGHAGVQTAASLRDEGFDGTIHLLDAQKALPYQRPPLSKAFLKGDAKKDSIVLRGEQFYTDRGIDLLLDTHVAAIDPHAQTVQLKAGVALGYDHLILATGARARPLPIEGADFKNVFSLRDLADAESIRASLSFASLSPASHIVVIGAGFIGLEFAAVAAKLGADVTVVEPQPRVMSRAISATMSDAFAQKHSTMGVKLMMGCGVSRLHGERGSVSAVETTDRRRLPADIVIVGIGVLAKDRLASQVGITCDNGIVVDDHLRTSSSSVFAVGDNNNHPNPYFRGRLRLESVQNAVDQAKSVARTLTGKAAAYSAVPWFWSDQADYKLQIAGVSQGLSRHVVRGDSASAAFSVFGFEGERLVVVESLNRPADHMVGRKVIEADIALTPEQAADPNFDLRGLASRSTL
jgi:3-phenylpropionate/trans-cinnamate dioxygenase ferredoxin reductase component